MYHVGKISKIFAPENKDIDSADDTVQSTVLMWDENLITVDVNPKLGKKIRDGDIVLVDYSPVSPNIPTPKMIVIKILHGNIAKKTWKEYKNRFEKLKKQRPPAGTPPVMPQQIPPGYR